MQDRLMLTRGKFLLKVLQGGSEKLTYFVSHVKS